MSKKRRIGILTGGGDVPGLNVAIKAVVSRAKEHGIEVVGLRRGWMSVLNIDPDSPETVARWTIPLNVENVRTIDRTGGTVLHTSRTNPGNINADAVPEHILPENQEATASGTVDCIRHAVRVLDHLGLEAVIPIGGDDTLSFAVRLHRQDFRVLAIPKTMDNDVFGTDYCIGFSTAVTRSIEAITAFRTPLGSHERIGLVEVFGRNCGETALFAAYLADVDRTVISEVPFDLDRLIHFLIEDREANPSHYAIVVLSEGARLEGGQIVQHGEADAYGHLKLGGIGNYVAQEIKRRAQVNTMTQQLGYIMRSGPPDSLDRMVATSFGNLAMDLVAMEHTGRMVALQQGVYTTVPLDLVLASKKRVDVTALYDPENYRPKVRDVLGKSMFLD